jgi:hypothetical protein
MKKNNKKYGKRKENKVDKMVLSANLVAKYHKSFQYFFQRTFRNNCNTLGINQGIRS